MENICERDDVDKVIQGSQVTDNDQETGQKQDVKESEGEKSEDKAEEKAEAGTGKRFAKGWLIAKLILMAALAMGLVMVTVCIRNGESFSMLLVDIRTDFVDNAMFPYAFKNKLTVLAFVFSVLVVLALFTQDFWWKLKLGKWEFSLSPGAACFRWGINLSLLIMAVCFVFLGVRFTQPAARAAWAEWDGDSLIAHAGGGIEEQNYTNSKEAFLNSYESGLRTIEMDFVLTSDDKLVCCHDWGEQMSSDYEADYVYSEEEFLNIRIYDKYTPMSLETLMELMLEYEDVWIVTDTKDMDAELVRKEFRIMVETAEKVGAPELLDRFVVQLYDYAMYDVVEEIYSFPSYVLTLYLLGGVDEDSFREHCRFLRNRDINSITMWQDWFRPEFREIADTYGINIYVHTVNNADKVEEMQAWGVRGFYTDYVTPDMIP